MGVVITIYTIIIMDLLKRFDKIAGWATVLLFIVSFLINVTQKIELSYFIGVFIGAFLSIYCGVRVIMLSSGKK